MSADDLIKIIDTIGSVVLVLMIGYWFLFK